MKILLGGWPISWRDDHSMCICHPGWKICQHYGHPDDQNFKILVTPDD